MQRRVELVALVTEARKTKSFKGSGQLVSDRLQGTGLQIAVAACPVEIVEHREQLGDGGGLGALGNELLVPQRALAVVVVLRLHALQRGLQLGNLIGFRGRRRCGRLRRRPTGGRAGVQAGRSLACSRISPVSGSMRRLSVTVTGSYESFELTCSPGHPRQPRRPRRHRRKSRPDRHQHRRRRPARPGWPRRWPGPEPGSRRPASPSRT